MDPDGFSASMFKWGGLAAPPPPPPPPPPRELGGLEELFQAYGIRYFTAAKIAELGFTVNTLLDMRDEELDDMMNSLCQIFRWDLLVGERYGIRAAVRAERRRHLLSADASHALDALSQEGLSEEKDAAGSGVWEMVVAKQRRRSRMASMDEDDADETEDDGGNERQREHPFIVTEPGEVARGKKNGLDYLFHLYEQCREFLIQVQNIAKDRGEKCPTKVTNQVFRYAKKAGTNYINKPKMRHYVHCYALHCLDEETSNALRRAFKERGENVGAWRQACYKPLVAVAARQGWDIDAIFNAHPRLSIWYVPTKLRQLCHAERSTAAAASSSITAAGVDHLPF
ncbi:floricaula protein-like [Salvia splendens]|uniref:floricaula protein-like n=1 Tax=Salvia splendens TaxID=180675 RepID=UPI0011054879|nr:floricaula protein-like [Salvia splendens]